MGPLHAALTLAARHGLPTRDAEVLKDGSNLLVHLRPAPVVLRVATFTAFIRRDPLPYLQREVALAAHLAAVGAAVVPPSDLLSPGPHAVGEWWATAWQHLPHHPTLVADADDALAALDALCPALASFRGSLPVYGPAGDDLDLALECCVRHSLLSADESAALRAERDALLALVAGLEHQAQHGDAHPRNLLVTPDGLVWNDLEDCCTASPLWDLATLARRDPSGVVRAVAVERFGAQATEAMLALRALQASVWTTLHAARPTLQPPPPPPPSPLPGFT